MCKVTKTCTTCKVEKSTSEFHLHSRHKDGFRSECKLCRSNKSNPRVDRKICIELGNKWCPCCKRILPLDRYNKKGDFVRSKCKNCEYNKSREYITQNKEKYNQKRRELLRSKKENPEVRQKITDEKRKYKQKRKLLEPIYKAKINIAKLLRESIVKQGWTKKSKTFQILGCDWDTFRIHIESKFTEGMSWDNQGLYGWHFDHIVPVSSAKNEEELLLLNHYTNFQPLWAKDNLRKSNKIV